MISVNVTVLHERQVLTKQKFHIPLTATRTLIHESIVKIYIQNIKDRKMIFMSNQQLCLNLNELKFELTTYYMSVN